MSLDPVPLVASIVKAAAERVGVANPPIAAAQNSFSDLLLQGIDSTATKLDNADRLLARAATDDSIPLHQVTYALEEARISLELMIQVRNRLIDASQQLMNMQL